MSSFTFDGDNRKIHLDISNVVNGKVTIDLRDMWSRYCDWSAAPGNSVYPRAFDILFIDMSDGNWIGPFLWLRNDYGWIGVPPPVDGVTIVLKGGAFYGKSKMLPLMENLPEQETSLIIEQAFITNGVETTSTGMSDNDIQKVATALLAALNATTVPVNIKKINDCNMKGDGSAGNPWGPA